MDSSGLRLIYTPELRQYDAGVLEVGHMVNGFTQVIPPNAESFLHAGECSKQCLMEVSRVLSMLCVCRDPMTVVGE